MVDGSAVCAVVQQDEMARIRCLVELKQRLTDSELTFIIDFLMDLCKQEPSDKYANSLASHLMQDYFHKNNE
jgi:hypothetical protein